MHNVSQVRSTKNICVKNLIYLSRNQEINTGVKTTEQDRAPSILARAVANEDAGAVGMRPL